VKMLCTFTTQHHMSIAFRAFLGSRSHSSIPDRRRRIIGLYFKASLPAPSSGHRHKLQ
jgi:hypothetical protein